MPWSSVEIVSVVGLGVVVFASTNIDDVVLLSLFFADHRFRARSVVLGQFLGIGALVLASSICALAAVVVPEGFASFLGVIPLVLGVWKLRSIRRGRGDADEDDPLEEEERAAAQRHRSQVLSVALVTVANGADNLGMYVPLFAEQPSAIPLYAAVFAVMTGIWCFSGHALVDNRPVRDGVRRYGQVVLPFVLIGLGVHVLSGIRVLFD
jgi:cadmium resistance protein CadD (predicted permease)